MKILPLAARVALAPAHAASAPPLAPARVSHRRPGSLARTVRAAPAAAAAAMALMLILQVTVTRVEGAKYITSAASISADVAGVKNTTSSAAPGSDSIPSSPHEPNPFPVPPEIWIDSNGGPHAPWPGDPILYSFDIKVKENTLGFAVTIKHVKPWLNSGLLKQELRSKLELGYTPDLYFNGRELDDNDALWQVGMDSRISSLFTVISISPLLTVEIIGGLQHGKEFQVVASDWDFLFDLRTKVEEAIEEVDGFPFEFGEEVDFYAVGQPFARLNSWCQLGYVAQDKRRFRRRRRQLPQRPIPPLVQIHRNWPLHKQFERLQMSLPPAASSAAAGGAGAELEQPTLQEMSLPPAASSAAAGGAGAELEQPTLQEEPPQLALPPAHIRLAPRTSAADAALHPAPQQAPAPAAASPAPSPLRRSARLSQPQRPPEEQEEVDVSRTGGASLLLASSAAPPPPQPPPGASAAPSGRALALPAGGSAAAAAPAAESWSSLLALGQDRKPTRDGPRSAFKGSRAEEQRPPEPRPPVVDRLIPRGPHRRKPSFWRRSRPRPAVLNSVKPRRIVAFVQGSKTFPYLASVLVMRPLASTIVEPEDGADERCMQTFKPYEGPQENSERLLIGSPIAHPMLGEVVGRLAREPELVRVYLRGIPVPPEYWNTVRLDLREDAPDSLSNIIALRKAQEPIQVFVQVVTFAEREEFIVDKSDPVVLLVALVYSRSNFRIGPFRMIFMDSKGEELSLDNTFAQSNIQDGSTISLYFEMRSGRA